METEEAKDKERELARQEFARLRAQARGTDKQTAKVLRNLDRALDRLSREREREADRMAMAGFLRCGHCGRLVRTGFPLFGIHAC